MPSSRIRPGGKPGSALPSRRSARPAAQAQTSTAWPPRGRVGDAARGLAALAGRQPAADLPVEAMSRAAGWARRRARGTSCRTAIRRRSAAPGGTGPAVAGRGDDLGDDGRQSHSSGGGRRPVAAATHRRRRTARGALPGRVSCGAARPAATGGSARAVRPRPSGLHGGGQCSPRPPALVPPSPRRRALREPGGTAPPPPPICMSAGSSTSAVAAAFLFRRVLPRRTWPAARAAR